MGTPGKFLDEPAFDVLLRDPTDADVQACFKKYFSPTKFADNPFHIFLGIEKDPQDSSTTRICEIRI
jgi:hypothetical protein